MCIAYWHAWEVSYVMAGCNVVAILTTAEMYAETVECMSNAGSVWYVGV